MNVPVRQRTVRMSEQCVQPLLHPSILVLASLVVTIVVVAITTILAVAIVAIIVIYHGQRGQAPIHSIAIQRASGRLSFQVADAPLFKGEYLTWPFLGKLDRRVLHGGWIGRGKLEDKCVR